MKKQDFDVWNIPSRYFFTKNSEIIAEHELKKLDYAKYSIQYGKGRTKTFTTKKEAMIWIKKNKKYFHHTAVYLKRKM